MPYPFVYLASQSPRRQQLLDQLGARFELLLPGPEEDAEALETERLAEAPADYVQRVCAAKARAASLRIGRAARGMARAPILTADTTVALHGVILGKPANADDAAAMLSRLSGRTHDVLTAVMVMPAEPDRKPGSILSISRVRVAMLTSAAIDRYVASGEPFGKAGAYGIQGRAAEFIAHIDGSYSGIMGLPLYETAALLRAAGVEF